MVAATTELKSAFAELHISAELKAKCQGFESMQRQIALKMCLQEQRRRKEVLMRPEAGILARRVAFKRHLEKLVERTKQEG